MPCSCFGKKDKKGGGPLNKEEELYRPRDSRERDPAAPATTIPTGSPAQSKQQPLLEGAPPPTPGTPPATPTTPGGDARLRPEDDADKATRRRDVVASFYSDQCELIGFKTTGSRPPSAHVGSQQDGPAATSSPATSSPSSTRSLGASCRADLAEKRREFFRELAADDDDLYRGSRPTSRLTDPGSQQTPRHSHYQEQQHHTLPHNKTSPRNNKFAATHLVLQNALNRKSAPNAEENQPLLHSPSEQGPKIILAKPVSEITKLFNSKEAASESERSKEKVSDKTPLLSDEQDIDSQMVIESPVSLIVADASSKVVPNVVNQSLVEENKMVISESEKVELIDISPKEVPVITNESKQFEVDVSFPTDFNKNSESSIEPSIVSSELVNDKVPEEIKFVEDSTFITKPEVPVVDACNPQINLVVDEPLLIPETEQNSFKDLAKIESHKVIDDAQIICESENGTIDEKSEVPGIVDSRLAEATSRDEHLFKMDLSQETNFQTHPVIVNETLKEPILIENKENTPQNTLTFETQLEQMPQTIVETTRQFISGSPDEQKSSQTIVETTRQFITGPPEEQTTQTIIETTQQFMSENPDELNSSQSIVETTRQFISSIPDDAESQNLMEKAQQFLSSSPDSHTIVKTTQHFVSGNPDEQVTQTIVQTTQQIVSENPDEQKTQTVIETKQSFPTSSDSFFLTSVEEPNDIPENFLLQSGTTTTTTVFTDEPVSFQSQLTELPEELIEEPRLPDVPCFGAPPPPSSPPPPLPEGQVIDLLSSAPSTEQHSDQSPIVITSEQQQNESETNSMSFTSPSSLPQSQLEETEALPAAPPTPPTPRVDDVPPLLPSSSSPIPVEGNELLPPTPPTPPREDDLPPAPLTPTKEKKDTVTTESTTATINSTTPAVTCGVEIVSSSALEDDGLGSEIDDALETIEGLSEEGNNNNNIERAAASS